MSDLFTTRLDVRISDTDAQGHMTGAAYVAFANHAFWTCVRAAGVDVDGLLASGVGPVNLETNIRFLHELRGGDRVDVSCRLAFGDGKTYQVDQDFRTTGGELAATVTGTYGLLDLQERRLVPNPAFRWLQFADRPELLGLDGETTAQAPPDVIRLLVAEDQHMIRGALVALLTREPDMEVVAELERGDAVLDAALDARPDVAVLDIDMPGTDGLTVAQHLHEQLPTCKTLVLTDPGQPGHLLTALNAHVRGFLLKDAPAATLADGIRRVVRGERVIDPDLIVAAIEIGESPLTPRETDVLRAARQGSATDEMAAMLALSPATVRNYLSNAISKVGARNRMGAIRIASDAGWL
jgi:two-component system, NarL family, response regulator DesR